MPGEPNEELDMKILRERADGSDELTCGSPPAGRLSFDLVPGGEVLPAVVSDRALDPLDLRLG